MVMARERRNGATATGARPPARAAALLAGTPHQPSRAYEPIVAQVQRLVEEGALAPGDRLPSERELCERFRVGRSSVRDAIRVLEAKGLVKARQGGGTTVQRPSPDSVVDVLAAVIVRRRGLVDELMDVRAIVEPALAARAAASATREQIARLRAVVERHRERVRRGEPAVAEDTEFHNPIASSARNGVLLAVLDTLVNLLSDTRRRVLQVEGRARTSLAGHERVLRAIEARSPRAAEEAMRRHLRAIAGLVARSR